MKLVLNNHKSTFQPHLRIYDDGAGILFTLAVPVRCGTLINLVTNHHSVTTVSTNDDIVLFEKV